MSLKDLAIFTKNHNVHEKQREREKTQNSKSFFIYLDITQRVKIKTRNMGLQETELIEVTCRNNRFGLTFSTTGGLYMKI